MKERKREKERQRERERGRETDRGGEKAGSLDSVGCVMSFEFVPKVQFLSSLLRPSTFRGSGRSRIVIAIDRREICIQTSEAYSVCTAAAGLKAIDDGNWK